LVDQRVRWLRKDDKLKRVVCGLKPDGSSSVLSDGPAPKEYGPEDPIMPPGMITTIMWNTESERLSIHDEDRTPSYATKRRDHSPGSTEFAVCTFSPGAVSAMHRTNTVDYCVVVAGEMAIRMTDGAEALLQQGDCIVELGGIHEWRNCGEAPAILAYIMLGVEPSLEKSQP